MEIGRFRHVFTGDHCYRGEMYVTNSAAAPIRQACALPFRICRSRIEFCLITSLKKGCWIFPKGIIDAGETPTETALKESLEEAGLRGKIVGKPLGTYVDHKWGKKLEVTALLMEVTHCEDDWPEARYRRRRWTSSDLAVELLAKKQMRDLVHVAVGRVDAAWRRQA